MVGSEICVHLLQHNVWVDESATMQTYSTSQIILVLCNIIGHFDLTI